LVAVAVAVVTQDYLVGLAAVLDLELLELALLVKAMMAAHLVAEIIMVLAVVVGLALLVEMEL
jgi:hypothetical protein